jgi:glycosyltransferase involved in cell wall biosynthesis
MGAGAVPVVINAGGQKEIVKDSKNGYLWNTKEELVDKTELLMKDHALLEKISYASRDKAKEFSENEFCQKVSNLIT